MMLRYTQGKKLINYGELSPECNTISSDVKTLKEKIREISMQKNSVAVAIGPNNWHGRIQRMQSGVVKLVTDSKVQDRGSILTHFEG